MNVNRLLCIDNQDALHAVREFLANWWLQVGLDAMLAPVELADDASIMPQVIEDPSGLVAVNPYAPIMSCNTACLIEDFIQSHPASRLAVMLRPCEFRAWVELQKRHHINLNPAATGSSADCITLGVDCSGTFSFVEYQRRSEQEKTAEMLWEGLRYGADGNFYPRPVRQACQLCDWPAALGADIAIGSAGVVTQGVLLVIAKDELTDERLGLSQVTYGEAGEELIVTREALVGKLADRQAKAREQLASGTPGALGEINSLLGFFARCTLCADCLDACPIYDGEFTGMLGVGEAIQGGNPLLAELVAVSRWLASCSGCGMCQEACQNGAFLGQIITNISHRIRSDLRYTAGEPHQKLPWSA